MVAAGFVGEYDHRCDLRCEWCGRRITMSFWIPFCCRVCDDAADAEEREHIMRRYPFEENA